MKILITGGHFSPAYALIQYMKEKTKIVVAGRKYAFEGDNTLSYEFETCQKEGIAFVPISSGRIQRKLTRYTFTSILKIPKGLASSIAILKKEKPDVVVSFGGYLAVPIVISAYLLKIPIVLHEQTLHAGYANKFLARFASVICISYKESEQYFPKEKIVFTGLPIRKEVFERKDIFKFPQGDKVIYVTGGSAGAHAINSLVEKNLEKILKKYIIVHQTGDTVRYKDFERLSEFKKSLPKNMSERYILKKYIFPDEIGTVYYSSDVVISRSGANTIAELLVLSKKALLIPLPGGQSGEQLGNAEYFVQHGVGQILIQDDITDEVFLQTIDHLMSAKAESSISENTATEKLYTIIQSVYEKKKHTKKT